MNIYRIEIRVDDNYQEIECSSNTPFMLVDEIKTLVKEYFKES